MITTPTPTNPHATGPHSSADFDTFRIFTVPDRAQFPHPRVPAGSWGGVMVVGGGCVAAQTGRLWKRQGSWQECSDRSGPELPHCTGKSQQRPEADARPDLTAAHVLWPENLYGTFWGNPCAAEGAQTGRSRRWVWSRPLTRRRATTSVRDDFCLGQKTVHKNRWDQFQMANLANLASKGTFLLPEKVRRVLDWALRLSPFFDVLSKRNRWAAVFTSWSEVGVFRWATAKYYVRAWRAWEGRVSNKIYGRRWTDLFLFFNATMSEILKNPLAGNVFNASWFTKSWTPGRQLA